MVPAPPPPRHNLAEIPTLSTPRLSLRPLVAADAGAIQEISFYDGVPAASAAEALSMLGRIHADCAAGQSLHWGICLADTGEVVGTCGFYRGFPGNVGEIGYVLKEAHRGRGLMTEAVRRIVDFGLTTLALGGVVAFTDRDNAASVAVLKRADFTEVPSDDEGLKFAR